MATQCRPSITYDDMIGQWADDVIAAVSQSGNHLLACLPTGKNGAWERYGLFPVCEWDKRTYRYWTLTEENVLEARATAKRLR